MNILATVDSQICVAKDDLSDKIWDEILGALSVKNPARDAAQKEQIGGWWNIPEYIEMWAEDEDFFYLPRGFAPQLMDGLDFYKIDLEWIDNRIEVANDERYDEVAVRDYQDEAIRKLLSMEQGVWEAPPGAGKTVGILELIRRSGQRALVITDKTNIAEQWSERSSSFLGCPTGIIGDGKFEERGITVALQQTLWGRRDELQRDGFFSRWGFVCLDECHHLPAATFTDVLGRFPAKYRFGVSGTPYKAPGADEIVRNSLGVTVEKTSKNRLRKAGWLIKPDVQIHKTDFKASFYPTHQCIDGVCRYTQCTRDKKKKRHQNNYSEIMSELVKNTKRNEQIAKVVAKEIRTGACVVVLSKRLGHLDSIMEIVGRINGRTDNLFSFTGRETTDERMEIQKRAEDGSCGLFSTIADEALDIPRIESIHLVWPTRNTDITRQQIGRCERPHREKKRAIVHDYYDGVGPLRGQIRDRVNKVYIVENLDILGAEELIDE